MTETKVPMSLVTNHDKNTAIEAEGPMTFLRGTMSSLSDAGKRVRPAVGPLSHLSDEASEVFPAVMADCGPTSDCLPVKIICGVTSLCELLSKILFQPFNDEIFLNFKKADQFQLFLSVLLIEFSFNF